MFYEQIRPYRLAARTPGSHPGNRGSIPRGAMEKIVTIYGGELFHIALRGIEGREKSRACGTESVRDGAAR